MPWFRCLVRGDDFPIDLPDASGPTGFYVTRFVEAPDSDGAEQAVLEALRAEPKLRPTPGQQPSDAARVVFEEIAPVSEQDVPAVQPGFAFFPMD